MPRGKGYLGDTRRRLKSFSKRMGTAVSNGDRCAGEPCRRLRIYEGHRAIWQRARRASAYGSPTAHQRCPTDASVAYGSLTQAPVARRMPARCPTRGVWLPAPWRGMVCPSYFVKRQPAIVAQGSNVVKSFPRSLRMTIAALRPGPPVTEPPGWVVAPV